MILSRAVTNRYENKALTFVGDVVVFEVVAGERLVLHHAELNGLHDVFLVVELVVSEVDLLQVLGDGRSVEDLAHTLVSEQITAQVDFLER